ncbi:FCD domain-containing protein [Bradyrhizobium sp. U87765 SZCCT0131]|uniref:GntR family transcriptional regulator n=1 Tax=unclassified Bradyrhizobium TaxID=2631580 RepID=UPI001BAA3E4B|nr:MULTISPECIES: FCD domain-containing protein [unclassified Bradyrhizobium]MBR1221602.1 FCD domain-containing protein [Bradyrhizobium sp. U87765 SZCCT0131]MBR1264475.1 FCD domain-containing protein [Bradyrhizobium sp. U87765 SZCCT0134]MBR1304618.1 FCD domain-containing protein [Bradyrhizobium sp. U87765 SZCCT0110]MBR1322525.1 FCD domain-containing protein [Bradyrhizobium sp. U87765 SZCCT0109]MBR1346547.1 FCD domain-containing protein [Bradyrhizobium sp. U87765 SZCCT0048]
MTSYLKRPAHRWGPGPTRGEVPKTLAGRVAQQLRQDIIRHRLEPGERLQFEKLSKLYDVGTSPLREALFQVAAQGLVMAEDHKGFFVAPIHFDEMFDVSKLRANLECFAIRGAIREGKEDWEVDLLAAFHRLKRAGLAVTPGEEDEDKRTEWEDRHRDFHYALCKGCGSPWLLHFFDELYDHMERYRRYFWKYAERAVAADSEHEAIMKAALDRDEDLAASLLQAHFERQAKLTMVLRQRVERATAPAD